MWKSAAEYFERLQSSRPAVNVISLVPNGQLRLAIVGLEARAATPREAHEMNAMLRQALDEGAWGFSTGLEYAAEMGASEEEIQGLCQTVAHAGGLYATHTRRRDAGAVEAVEEAVRVARATGVRVQVSHLLPRSGPADSARCVDAVEEARMGGLDIAFDMHTRPYGVTYLSAALPPWAGQHGRERLADYLRDVDARERMKTFPSILSASGDWRRIVLFDNPVWPEYANRSLAEIAEEREQDPFDAVCDLLLEGLDNLERLMVLIHCYSEREQEDVFAHPLCVPGSDATDLAPDGPLAESTFHGAYTWASWFYRFMVREKRRLSTTEAIHKLTGAPAAILNLTDRGVLRVGAYADIAVFDPGIFGEKGTMFSPNRLAVGMVHVLVNGAPTLCDGALTGARNGFVLRRLSG